MISFKGLFLNHCNFLAAWTVYLSYFLFTMPANTPIFISSPVYFGIVGRNIFFFTTLIFIWITVGCTWFTCIFFRLIIIQCRLPIKSLSLLMSESVFFSKKFSWLSNSLSSYLGHVVFQNFLLNCFYPHENVQKIVFAQWHYTQGFSSCLLFKKDL